MSTQIRAKVQTHLNTVNLELPILQPEFAEALLDAGIMADGRNNYSVEYLSCKHDFLDDFIAGAQDLHEINVLAALVDDFSDSDIDNYNGLLDAWLDEGVIDIRKAIDVAYNLHNYNIEPCINDLQELGEAYVQNEAPDLNERIFENIKFDIIGADIKNEQNGVFTSIGYVSNFHENFDTAPKQTVDSERYIESIDGLTRTAMEMAKTDGNLARAEIDVLRSSVSNLVNFWSLDEHHIDQFDMDVDECIQQHESGMQMGGME